MRKHAKDFTSEQIHQILEASRGQSAALTAKRFGTSARVVHNIIRKAGGRRPLDDPYPFPGMPYVYKYGPGGVTVHPLESLPEGSYGNSDVVILGVDDDPEAEQTLNQIFKR